MSGLRLSLRRHRWLAALVVAAALALRIVVPAGFMPALDHGRVIVAICNGEGPGTIALAITTAGGDHGHDDGDGDRAHSPCAFADLALPVIGGTDPLQLAAALLFILATALVRALSLPPRAPARLRPPLRAPPATA